MKKVIKRINENLDILQNIDSRDKNKDFWVHMNPLGYSYVRDILQDISKNSDKVKKMKDPEKLVLALMKMEDEIGLVEERLTDINLCRSVLKYDMNGVVSYFNRICSYFIITDGMEENLINTRVLDSKKLSKLDDSYIFRESYGNREFEGADFYVLNHGMCEAVYADDLLKILDYFKEKLEHIEVYLCGMAQVVKDM